MTDTKSKESQLTELVALNTVLETKLRTLQALRGILFPGMPLLPAEPRPAAPLPPYATPLCGLAVKYMTDKAPGFHDYTPKYYDAILKYLGDPAGVKRVGEIGIGFLGCMCHVSMQYKAGASLRMWEEFFPAAEIHGYDIRRELLVDEGRIRCHYMDQSSVPSMHEAYTKACGLFDLILDDGSHQLLHQLNTKEYSRHHLRVGGLLIIEDIRTEHFEARFRVPSEGMEVVDMSPVTGNDNYVIYKRVF
jgi:hypothetical protein